MIKEIESLCRREAEMGISEQGSWHARYRHSSYVFIGGLDTSLNEGDIVVMFSQVGEIVDIHLARDKQSGQSKGFAFLCFEDQRSTVLAVENFNGVALKGRLLRVDHCDEYRRPQGRALQEHSYEEMQKQVYDFETMAPEPVGSPKEDVANKVLSRAQLIKQRRREREREQNFKHLK